MTSTNNHLAHAIGGISALDNLSTGNKDSQTALSELT